MKEKNELVAIYIRTSTEEQNPYNQLKDCKSINKWGSYILLEDKQSAWKEDKERPAFNELNKLIKKRSIKYIIVWDLDRIYRNRKRLIEFFDLCKLYKITILSYRQQWLNQLLNIPEPFNEIMYDMMLQVMGWLAEEESTKKSERVKAAVSKRGGITKSKYGNKWGRKNISTYKKNRIKEYYNAGYSTRATAQELGVGKSTVHKYFIEFSKEKNLIKQTE